MIELKKLIETAFSHTPIPTAPLCDTYDDEGVGDYFAGRPRYGHTIKDLRYHSVAISFFKPEALRYYLPVFMLAELDDPEEADIIADSIISIFYSYGDLSQSYVDYFEGRTIIFSGAERKAIIAFFNYFIDRYGADEQNTAALAYLLKLDSELDLLGK
ncbi:MAG: hypothetical protein ACI9EW_000240 [Cellvibrionaceae bacterium]|jgi:hypothetical protein